ncbi:ATP-binding cassette domain-containing protein [Billgrantia pellis]|uniref:ATP-binding cassette domain-containing protein n=1 Tax=Billgrantia pellis TaxID=2606936 RepID=A0A7V7KG04_9GAMM|nr:ATP-binding cassette domain-containing protein [Halomonas pellis]KAA0011376.1 ATP-binding cassette domain-containing protein [Halomonas pellis]
MASTCQPAGSRHCHFFSTRRGKALSEECLRLDRVAIGELAEVSLDVAPGEIVCLSGASGSGKSRLLRAVADLEPHGGEAWLGERAQSSLPGHVWRRCVMLVPAESHWWEETVGEHFPQEPEASELEALGLAPDALAWQVGRLSTGEKQRLGLLRAVSREPGALLLDEPTANLDDATSECVEAWLKARIHERGWPTLWVAHDRGQIARVAGRHRRIANGRLEEVDAAWT